MNCDEPSRCVRYKCACECGTAFGSNSHNALLHAQATCDICASVETLAELGRVLDREKFNTCLDRQSRQEFVALMRRDSRIFVVEDADLMALEPVCCDPKDNKFLALAEVAEASVLDQQR